MTAARGGRLVLVATPLGNLGDLAPRAAEVLGQADVVACEDTRHTGKLLSLCGIEARRLVSVHAHNEQRQAAWLVERMAAGDTVALVSDAGMPAISDPGQRLVAAAVEAGVEVTVVPGPSAVVAALAVSGLPTDRFAFEGFLPRKGGERSRRLAAVAREERTVVLYEAPHRLAGLLDDLASVCGDGRRVAVVRELTKIYEEVWRGTLAEAREWVEGLEAGPRGEHVVVVEAAAAVAPAEVDVEEALQNRLAAGMPTKAAVAEVASTLGVPKRQVYEIGVRLTKGG